MPLRAAPFEASEAPASELTGRDALLALLTDGPNVLQFDIQSIMARFATSYSEIFCISKKCHFDSLPVDWSDEDRVVDGARSKWCTPLLLDALIMTLEANSFNLSHRRTFNQQKILHECIHAELQERHTAVFSMLMERKMSCALSHVPPSSCPSVSPSPSTLEWASFTSSVADAEVANLPFLEARGLVAPWTDMTALRQAMLAGPASKSRDKLVSIVTWLCSHPALRTHDWDLERAFTVAIAKSLFVYPAPAPRAVPELSTRARKKARTLASPSLLLPHAGVPIQGLGTSSPSSCASPLCTPTPPPTPPRQHRYALRDHSRFHVIPSSPRVFKPIRSTVDLTPLRAWRPSPAPDASEDGEDSASSDSSDDTPRAKKRSRRPVVRGVANPHHRANINANVIDNLVRGRPVPHQAQVGSLGKRKSADPELRQGDTQLALAEAQDDLAFADLCEQLDGSDPLNGRHCWELIPSTCWDHDDSLSPELFRLPALQVPVPRLAADMSGLSLDLWDLMERQFEQPAL